MKQTKKGYFYRTSLLFLILFSVWMGLTLFFIIKNQFDVNYKNLSKSNQMVLKEFEDYYRISRKKPVWAGYDLDKYSFLVVNDRGGEAYLINPRNQVNSIFAKEIKMPRGFGVKVYRIAAMTPSLYKTYGLGSFNTLNEHVDVCNNEVFYLRYKKDQIINDGEYDSRHFITLLSHEAFHNQVQQAWGNEGLGGRFSTELLTDKEKKILAIRYGILQSIQDEVWKEPSDLSIIKAKAQEYITESEKLRKLNPSYFKNEMLAELFEGTANYVSAKASKATNYRYNVTCYSDPTGKKMEHIPFNEIMPLIESRQMPISSISTNWVYSSGGLWCEVLDKLGSTSWQVRLNNQTNQKPVTLYDLVKEIAD